MVETPTLQDLVLDQLAVGCSAIFDAKRRPGTSRLTLHPLSSGTPDVDGLHGVLEHYWPAEAGPLALNLTSEVWLQALMQRLDAQGPVPHWQVEVPAFLMAEARTADAVQALATRGQPFILKGRPLAPLAAELLKCFRCAVVDVDEERRNPLRDGVAHPQRSLPFVQTGVRTPAEASASFLRGAQGVQGWPLGDPPDGHAARHEVPPGVASVAELMQRLDREEPVARLDEVFRRDPALAYRLMRYINSPGFGLSVEISSFQHAIMILGYQRLKRWLALLLTSTVENPDLRPMMFLAVRRGLLMEELARNGGDETQRNEAFICGVFSLLDRMLGRPFAEVLRSVPVPEQVQQALLEGRGPHAQPLALAVAVESSLPFDIHAAIEEMMLTPAEANGAVLKALATSRTLLAE